MVVVCNFHVVRHRTDLKFSVNLATDFTQTQLHREKKKKPRYVCKRNDYGPMGSHM